MKKYLITEEQLRNIKTVFVLYGLGAPFEDLKPIEPLSDEQIMGIVADKPFNSAIGFARAIEKHILGEKHDS